MSNKCLQCKAKYHCCKNGFAFVGIEDAKQIKETTGKEYTEFLDYSELSPDVLQIVQSGDPVHESSLRNYLLKDNKILRLQKRGRNCVFLKEGKCSIYTIRPKICQMYPHWCMRLLDGTLKVIDHDDNYCLVRNSTTLRTEDEEKLFKLFRDILDEGQYYKEHIDEFVKEHNIR